MVLGNTPRQKTDIFLEARKSFAYTMLFVYVDGKPVDMTGYEVRMVVDPPSWIGGDAVIDRVADPVDEPGGHFQVRLQASELDLEPDAYPYDVTMLSSTGYSVPVLKGMVRIGENTDGNKDNVYGSLRPVADVVVTLGNECIVQVCIDRPEFLVGPKGDKGDPGLIEVEAGSARPTNPEIQLWIDTSV